MVPTDIAVELPQYSYGRIAPRSGLPAKHSINIGASITDSDYRGELKVLLVNLSNESFKIESGERIAQMVITNFEQPELIQVDTLDSTERSSGGFGSTGVK